MNELELLKEIENLNKEITTGKLFARDLNEEDWDTLTSWWNALPDNGKGGIMIEKNNVPIVAGFIYETNSASVLLEWIISNPEYRDTDRQDAIEMLITEAEKLTKKMGYQYMFTIGRNKN